MEVEVRVTDRDGQAVTDLSRDDFRLLENGQQQRIATLEFVPQPAPISQPAPPEPARPGNAAGFDAASAAADSLRRSTFVYIATRGRRQDSKRVYDAVKAFIDERLAPGVFVSLEGTPFTSRRSDLYRHLDAMLTRGAGQPGSLVDVLAADLSRDIEYSDTFQSLIDETNQEFNTEVESLADRAAFYRRLRMYEYIDLIRALSIYPGRKVVVLFSTGLRTDEDNLDIMKVLEDEATKARVRFFVSDVAGLAASSPGGDAESGGSPSALSGDFGVDPIDGFRTANQDRQEGQDGLFELARRTGGRAVLNSNDFGEVFDVMLRRTSDYYLLGYYPRETEQRGRLRRIRVRVERKGLRISHQRGYYEERPFEDTSRAERNLRLHQALVFDTPYADLPIMVDHEFFRNSRGLPTLVYSVGLHVRDIPHSASRRGEKFGLTIVAQAVPSEGSGDRHAPPVTDDRRFEITVADDALRRLSDDPNSWLHYGSQMVLSPGEYEWKVVVRDDLTGLMGSYGAQVRVPGFRNRPGTSSLLLTSRVDDVGRGAERSKGRERGRDPHEDVLLADGSRFFASAVKKFRRGDPIYALYDVYDAGAPAHASPPAPRIALYRGRERVAPLPVTGHQTLPEPESKRIRYLAALATAELPAGSYTVAAMLPGSADERAVIYRGFEIVEPGSD